MIVPRHLGSTYRLQLNGLGFAGATALVPFLHDLGVETCYLSPVTRARSGSTHGYDVIDPTVLDPALGTAADFEALLAALDALGMGALLDIVPNHMGASTESPFFRDVLRLGQQSEYADWFDIAWDEQDGKVLLPVLGDPLADVLGRGELSVVTDAEGGPSIGYFENRFPLAPGSDDAGDIADVIAAQHYRLADWRVANTEINYRRFFDINELIGVRQEDPAVFAATHRLVLDLLADPRVRGVRVDHVDGLRDPGGYLEMLRAATTDLEPAPVVLIEKILEGDEKLPDWPVEGTTGYEVAAAIAGLFIDAAGAVRLRDAAGQASEGEPPTFAERAIRAKRHAIDVLLLHQRDQVVAHLRAAIDREGDRDLTTAVRELTAYLTVYRTYRQPGVTARAEDIAAVASAFEAARPGMDVETSDALDQVAAILVGELAPDSAGWLAAGAWQQFSGPATAKGVEDTAMYGSGQLLAASDVGCDPDRPARSVARFHEEMTERSARSPRAMTSTSTHDSKRSQDVRCRLAVLSEIPGEWEATVRAIDASLLGANPDDVPEASDRRYLYESAVGVWPVDGGIDDRFVSRLKDHVVKAARELKARSSWTEPRLDYEGRLTDLAARLVETDARESVETLVAGIAAAGATNSLASVLLKATVPGTPDTYQGDDSWFLALVDPDNRRPLDGEAHARELAALPDLADEALLTGWRDGRVKQFVLRRALTLRREVPELFDTGRYAALEATGAAVDHVVGFLRHGDDDRGRVVVVVPRLVRTLAGPGGFPVGAVWGDTALSVPSGTYRDLLTGRDHVPAGGSLAMRSVLAQLPLALLRAT
jgi:(1->4)-alpha-D-glucan 1-alpha-D-glucosylmutase